jgi:hypothetical protein
MILVNQLAPIAPGSPHVPGAYTVKLLPTVMFPAADDVLYDDKVITDKKGKTVHQSILKADWFKSLDAGDALVFHQDIEGHTILVDHVLKDGQVCIVTATGHGKKSLAVF